MAISTPLLAEDGSASVATAFMMSHHGLRRDLGRFRGALGAVARGDTSRVEAIRGEWLNYRGTLHGHHEVEDTRMFPGFAGQNAALRPVVDALAADHRKIDPLLVRGDRAFADLPASVADAAEVIDELATLLDAHLETEERELVPLLRAIQGFPPPTTEAEADMFAQGFAWSSHGIAEDVLERVYAMLPDLVRSKIPAARSAFAERCRHAWGTADAGASRTSVPDR